jgi:transposase
MAIVAEVFNQVVGVDTHARSHTLALIDPATGAVQGSASFPTSPAGLGRAVAWIVKRATGPALVVIEGVGSYGAGLARRLTVEGVQVVEPGPMPARQATGKDDTTDAARIARSVTGAEIDKLRQPRADEGVRAALRVLVVARENLNEERTRAINALTALVRTVDLGVDARRPLSKTQITTIAAWRDRHEPVELHVARAEAVRLARRILETGTELADNTTELAALVDASPAAPLTAKTGIGPVTAAVVLITWSHPGRIHSEAAFAAIAGVNPIPASSGNTTRHRLNRNGDRRLNRALDTIALTRMRSDPATQAYVTRRRAKGHTTRETKRILKRYIARQIFRLLEHPTTLDET